MTLDAQGRAVETTETGFLVSTDDWDEAVAETLAAREGLELTDRHWDVIGFLRDEYFSNNENQPNTRAIVKEMQTRWPDVKVTSQYLYQLFPGDPSKQAGRIAGLPESRRKGGY